MRAVSDLARAVALLLAASACGCKSGPPAAAHDATPPPPAPQAQPTGGGPRPPVKADDMSSLAKRLADLGYDRLFLGNDLELERLWKEPGASGALESLATDEQAPEAGRFLAAEVLARKSPDRFPPTGAPARAALARAYVAQLKAEVEANKWGMPGELDEPAGRHLVALGREALPALSPLLDDKREILYGGSKEAMVGNGYRWRVKDFAAFFIARISGGAFTVSEDPKARDREIARLRPAQ